MKIIFVKEYNTPTQYRAEGHICDLPPKEAKAFIKSEHARKATKADEKANEDNE
jgi:hypothetical protein